jgi:predicted dehydrogenase
LRGPAQEFVSSIQQGRKPLTDGVAGYRVVKLLEAAQASLERGGHPIEFKDGWLESARKVQPTAA